MVNSKVFRYVPTELESFFYTIEGTAYILCKKLDDIEFVYPMGNGKVLVGLYNRSVIVKGSDYVNYYIEKAKEKVDNLIIKGGYNTGSNGVLFMVVYNIDNGNHYRVKMFSDLMVCNCKDYDILSRGYGYKIVAYEHIYAVLKLLGFSKLTTYLKSLKGY